MLWFTLPFSVFFSLLFVCPNLFVHWYAFFTCVPKPCLCSSCFTFDCCLCSSCLSSFMLLDSCFQLAAFSFSAFYGFFFLDSALLVKLTHLGLFLQTIPDIWCIYIGVMSIFSSSSQHESNEMSFPRIRTIHLMKKHKIKRTEAHLLPAWTETKTCRLKKFNL